MQHWIVEKPDWQKGIDIYVAYLADKDQIGIILDNPVDVSIAGKGCYKFVMVDLDNPVDNFILQCIAVSEITVERRNRYPNLLGNSFECHRLPSFLNGHIYCRCNDSLRCPFAIFLIDTCHDDLPDYHLFSNRNVFSQCLNQFLHS